MRLHTGKLGGFEGGIRVPAVVAGGWLPSVLRGASYSGLVHMADWYPTIAAAAGLPIRDHRSSLVAAVDGASMWYRWLHNATSDRTLVLGEELAITQTVHTRHTRTYSLSDPHSDRRTHTLCQRPPSHLARPCENQLRGPRAEAPEAREPRVARP